MPQKRKIKSPGPVYKRLEKHGIIIVPTNNYVLPGDEIYICDGQTMCTGAPGMENPSEMAYRFFHNKKELFILGGVFEKKTHLLRGEGVKDEG